MHRRSSQRGNGPKGREGGRLSDVQIGNDTRTCWYQRSVHEPYLTVILDYVTALASVEDRSEVSFTFDRPKTRRPRDDFPQLVSVVRAADRQIVAAYNSLGLTSNDPNTVGDQAAATIGRAFAIYGEELFASVIEPREPRRSRPALRRPAVHRGTPDTG
jgi:hypothetical protein